MRFFAAFLLVIILTSEGYSQKTREYQAFDNSNGTAPVQKKRGRFAVPKKYYGSVAVSYYQLYNSASNGLIGANIPYAITDNHGNMTSSKFTQTLNSPFSGPMNSYRLDVQLGSRNHFVDLSAGQGSRTQEYFSAGYGYQFNRNAPLLGSVMIKASLSVGYSRFTKKIGNIDNSHKIIDVLGVEYDSTFDYTSYSSSNSNYGSDDTADAKNIAVSWWQDEWFVQPKVSIEWHPLHNKLFIGVNANFFVPISEIAQINLTQNDGGSQSANSKSFSLTRADVKLNNRTQPATPYAFRGLQLGVSLGYGGFVKDAVKQ